MPTMTFKMIRRVGKDKRNLLSISAADCQDTMNGLLGGKWCEGFTGGRPTAGNFMFL
jgi:hypothetical protein